VSNRVYKPDAWVILKFTNNDSIEHRVLAGFVEKPRNSDDWRVSKSIVNVECTPDTLHITCKTGSVYSCKISNYTLNDNLYNIWRAVSNQKSSSTDSVELIKTRPDWNDYNWNFKNN